MSAAFFALIIVAQGGGTLAGYHFSYDACVQAGHGLSVHRVGKPETEKLPLVFICVPVEKQASQ